MLLVRPSAAGAWLACLAADDPAAAISRLKQAYIEQRNPADATPADVSAEAWRNLVP